MSNTPLSPILSGKTTDVTPSALLSATASMTPEQKAEFRANVGATDAETSIPDDVKVALLDCFAHVAWVDDQGQTYYDALQAALYPLDHITAVYTQSGTVYDTDSLDSLKTDLVVTAVYESGNTETVPAANYNLSGTLSAGTSTITVSYGGKTTTFDVVVTSFYLWKYEASSGELLSAQEYAEKTIGSEGGTETLVDGVLRLNTLVHAQQSSSSYIKFAFTPTSTNGALYRLYGKLVEIPILSTTNNNTSGFRIQISNGTSGAQAYLEKLANETSIVVAYYEGATRKYVETDFALSEYHLFELKLENGTQSFSIDGQTVFTSNVLSTNYATANTMFNQAANSSVNPNGVITDIAWIGYSEVV